LPCSQIALTESVPT